jgi:hypothetical protein
MERGRRFKTIRWIIYPFLIGAIIYLIATQPRAPKTHISSQYSSFIESQIKEVIADQGDRIPFRLKIKNSGKMAWSSEGEHPIFLSYHLYQRDNYRTLQYDNRRFPLPRRIEPGQTFDMEIILRVPIEAKKYILQFDMVREGEAWFRDYGSRTAIIGLTVEEKNWPEDRHVLSLEYGKYTKIESSREGLNTIMKVIRQTLDHNQVAFEGKTEKISGFAAGSNYPQIWLRDTNTIIPAARYFYDQSFFTSWLEEHLAFQKQNGSLQDWIDSRGESDKNTTETDQESSAVQAAFQVYEILGPRWLEKTITGEKIIDRLERALLFVLHERWDEEHGLVTGAHTADWGDVDMVDDNQQAVYIDDRTHWTADIYDQSMFHQACLNLAEMMKALDESERSVFWEEKARSVKDNSDKWLWQDDKGFYRVHIHLDDLAHPFDEDDIFAMGGNTAAILSGLADEKKSRRIIEEASRRQEKYQISTISGTLLPPYPKDFFKHPLADDPYEYQNGAQWDWFGGRLIYAMFENGFAEMARGKLASIIQKNLKNRGFFEWDSKDGIGQGSDFYAGSAGSMGKALFEGYFGIDLGWDHLVIEPKLGNDPGRIHVYQPSNDLFVAYDFNYHPMEHQIILDYRSNFSKSGEIKIIIPWLEPQELQDLDKEAKNISVAVTNMNADIKFDKMNNDVFITFKTDFTTQHRAIISQK